MDDLSRLRTLWELFLAGGALMWPIAAMSLLVVAFGIERLVALRRSRFVPRTLTKRVGEVVDSGSVDPRGLVALCEAQPSALAAVVRAMLGKIGRPLPEIEHAAETAANREASRLYANIRPISLAVTITPLLGLLGTVQGMILAFYTTANLQAGANRASELAGGIYLALITTFAGLCVAIPAAVVAHWLEGRILSGCRRVDDAVAPLLRRLAAGDPRSAVQPAGDRAGGRRAVAGQP